MTRSGGYRRAGDGLGYESGRVGQFSAGEGVTGPLEVGDPVHSEGSPVGSVQVEGHQVPALILSAWACTVCPVGIPAAEERQ